MLTDILQKIGFIEKFKNFTHLSDCRENISTTDLDTLLDILKKINPEAKYFKKEKFFRLVIKKESRIFWIHIEVSPCINFMFYEMTEKGKYIDGFPMTALYRKLKNGDISGLGTLYYCSYPEFEKIINSGYALCKEIINAY